MSYLLFLQHGWADNHRGMLRLAQRLGGSPIVIAPNLGWWKTWWKMEALIQQTKLAVEAAITQHPELPWRIIGHSMGGLIWLELLDRYPDWHKRIHSLVLLGSPVGGAELARMIDPFCWGIGMARDLGINRRSIAAKIAHQIPTLSIAGDWDGGSDGVVTLGATQFLGAQWKSIPHLFHPHLRYHPEVVEHIQAFWQSPTIPTPDRGLRSQLIQYLQLIPGIVDGHPRSVTQASIRYRFHNGIALKQRHNLLHLPHVYVTDGFNRCLYTGYVGWFDASSLHRSVAAIPQIFGSYF